MIRRADNLDVYLLRHAEAYKNLAKVHGGGDQRLTPTGERQARTLGGLLLRLRGGAEGLQIVHQPEGRSEATAKNVGMVASRAVVENTDLIGVRLGVAGGLSEEELAIRYPEVAASLIAWRTNKGDLGSRPRVPGSEPMEEFADRIRRGLVSSIEACAPNDSLAVVGTTSTLNMMNHLLVNDGEFDRPNYDFIEFPLGSLAAWRISDEAPIQTMPIIIPAL
ncbi:MAG TPA: histidine phosphatase family protein [Patescibacteria group bacterium]|nr:histidine phosphatase family protein [Patescibacteria group bacterium]